MLERAPLPRGFQRSRGGPHHGRQLVVVLHGLLSTPRRLGDVEAAVREVYASRSVEVDFYIPQLRYSSPFSAKRPAVIVGELLAMMDRLCEDPRTYVDIVIIGVSIGAVFARRLFLAATVVTRMIPSEPGLENAGVREWGRKVSRIIHFGGINRGWAVSGRMGWWESFLSNTLGFLGHAVLRRFEPTIFGLRRGAPFIIQSRLQWLALRNSAGPDKPEPLVIQLLGTRDNLVAPDDVVDFAVDRSPSSPYYYIELPQTGHADGIEFRKTPRDPTGLHGAARRAIFVRALAGTAAELDAMAVDGACLADTLPPEPDKRVKHVVFVIHGIRDDGYWTRKVAQRIGEGAASAGQGGSVRCVTASYGYFAMLPFLLPWIRRLKVEWLMDQYVSQRACYPDAEFSYVGHSNGTYLLANALLNYPAIRFRNVMFAGSVVRRDYDWHSLMEGKRVERMLNMVATSDWVVALFPQGLEPFRWFDLGGAGFGGFRQARTATALLREIRYVAGGHSAALVESQWQHIANFIVNNKPPPSEDADYRATQPWAWRVAAAGSTLLLIAAAIGMICVGVLLVFPVYNGHTTTAQALVRVLGLLAYLAFLRFVVTRV